MKSKENDLPLNDYLENGPNDLDLFLDEEGILRCRARLQNAPVIDTSKRSILLPKKNHFTNRPFQRGLGLGATFLEDGG